MKKNFFTLMIAFLLCCTTFSYASSNSNANVQNKLSPAVDVLAVPSACLSGVFSQTGSPNWYSVSLVITNTCSQSVDLQQSTIKFQTPNALDSTVDVWGTFTPLSYPSGLVFSSVPNTSGGFIASLSNLTFPPDHNVGVLAPRQSITINYGFAGLSYVQGTAQVFLNSSAGQVGELDLVNTTAKPANVTQTNAKIDLMLNGQLILVAQVPWSGRTEIPNLPVGPYKLLPENVTDSQGNSYQGTAVPNALTVALNQKVNSSVSYNKITTLGSIKVAVPQKPSSLVGYNGVPSVVFTRADTQATTTQNVIWNATTTVSSLANQTLYKVSTPIITFAGTKCTGTFNPASLTSSSTVPPTTSLAYTCVPVPLDKVAVNVSGLDSLNSTVAVTFAPSDGATPTVKTIAITNGAGSDTVNLIDGSIYSVSATAFTGYTSLFSKQPLTAAPGAVENVTYQKQTVGGGRVIAYVVGWKTPPSATSLASAGYTNALVAFGLFSTTQFGAIVPAFDTITASYIASLHQAGIKVSLSIGGASTIVPGTSVNFHDVLVKAASPTAFQQTFINSLNSLIAQYGFDGVDIDIESGLNAGGSFSSPTGDIAALASILNALHASKPNLLISLAPQTANIAPTAKFDNIWANYASLIMQTHQSLSWVGVQVYNTGCMLGLDTICYGDTATSPDLSVAMAAGLLENWPATNASGGATGFQPYVSFLTPSQVVLGYPAPDAQGGSDGATVKSTAVIKRALQCLRTRIVSASSCSAYIPPRTYAGISGVFEWESTYDQNNNFKFATDLSSCVKSGNC